MLKNFKIKALVLIALSSCLSTIAPLAENAQATNCPLTAIPAVTQATGNNPGSVKVTYKCVAPTPTPTKATQAPAPKASTVSSPMPSPTPTPTPLASSCTTTITAIVVAGIKFFSGIVYKNTTTCVPAPPVVTNSIMVISNGYGPAYWDGSSFYNAPKIYHAPAGLTDGNAPIETVYPVQCPASAIQSDYNGAVQLSPYGINYTDTIRNNVATTTYANGTSSTDTTTTFRKTFYESCVYPSVKVLQCTTDITSVDYSGVTGKNVDPLVVIPTGSAPAVTTTTSSGSATTDPGTWSNVSVPGLVTTPAVGKVPAIEMGNNISTWEYTPKTPIQTGVGSQLNNPPALASKFISSNGSTKVPTECGGNLLLSFTVPLALVTNGEYNITGKGHSVYCYVIERNFGGNTFSGCSNKSSQTDSVTVSKYCGTVTVGSAGKDYSSAKCGTCPPGSATCTAPAAQNTCPPGSVNCTTGGSLSCPPSSATCIDTTPTYSCSILGSPTVTSPLGSIIDPSKTIQVLSQAATASNSSPWTLTWAKPIFASYGNMEPLSIQDQSTALILADGSQPFNWNQNATAPTQPTVGTPDLSALSDPNPSTLSGWGVDSTLVFYKKAAPNATFTVSQQARFTALFPFPLVTTDSNGNQIVTKSWIRQTGTCNAKNLVKFQVSGVKALP